MTASPPGGGPGDDTRALEACEARYRTLFAHAQVGILLADAQSRYLDANEAACRMLGYTREELVGKCATDIIAPSDGEHIGPTIDAINRGEGHRREWQFRRQDGSTFAAAVVATTLPDGRMLGLLHDLSDREQARASREHLAALVESSADAIVGKDLQGVVTSWNAGAREMFGYDAGEMIGADASVLLPDDRRQEEVAMLAAIAGGRRLDRLQTVRRTKDGRLLDVEVLASPVRDPTGAVVGVSTVTRDRTEMRARERELARMSRLYAALSQVNQAIVWTSDRDGLFRRVCRVLVEHGGFRMAWVGWHDPATNRVVPVAQHGDDVGFLSGIRLYADDRPEGRGPSGNAMRTGRPYVCNDTAADPAMAPWREEIDRHGLRAAAAFPVRERGEVRGALTVCASRVGFFGDKEVALLEEAATDVSFALDNLGRDAARRQAEQTLRSEKQFSDTMIESMTGVVYFYDGSGRFLRWNRNFELVTGFTGEEISKKHPLDFFRGTDRERVEQRIAEVFARGQASVEADFVAKDGRSIPYYFTGRRVEYEGRPCLVGVGLDIADRRRAETRLKESERKYRELVEHANSVIVRWNAEGRITFLNEYGQRFFGYAADEIVGRHVLETIVPPTESGGRDLRQLVERIGADPVAFEQSVNENVKRNGQRVWVAWTNRIERDDEGKVVGILSIGSDVTERRAAQAEREQRLRAEEADRVKSAFLATMSHELRTPLNSIIGFTGILLQGLAGPLNDEQAKQMGMVRGSARHLLALVNDVLDISKIEAGQLEVSLAPFDLVRSVEGVVALVRPQAEAKGFEIEVFIAPSLGRVVGDQRRFEQILLNLLSNAVKFTERGQVRLDVTERSGWVASTGGVPARAVCAEVRDTGVGIKAEDFASLFQPFRQIDSGLARRHEGTGLGLAICRRLATLLRGEITAESVWGHGSVFRVTLPIDGESVR